ncbi:S8 family peptidase [Pseudoduganella sp. OTU4001]|uniref:S8 family peptidase n=1 Tax=Pseudoduganella sp. OTU4001 TaxID=3043854 RepID=UPI00313AA97D
MRRWASWLALCWMLCGLAAASPAPPDPAPAAASGPEILVMLHLPAPHLRADGYSGAGYRDDAGRQARQRIAAALAREHGMRLLEDWPMPALNVDCYRMRLAAGQDAAAVIAALARDRRVAWAQAIQEFTLQSGTGPAGDPLYRVQPAAAPWQLLQLRKTVTGRKVLVAVVDSGVDASHPDLAGQVALQENFVDGQSYVAEEHGTAVAGVIAARADNGIGIAGVAPEARLMALRACWQVDGATRCNSFTLAKALNYALQHHAQVINLSLSGPQDRLLQQLVAAAQARGIRVVGAIDPQRSDGGFPANSPGVFAVAADDAPAAAGLALLAPGRDIPTTMPGARWGLVSGSSYAAAHITGMLALLGQLKPQLAGAQLREGIVRSSGRAPLTGVDLCATIMRITGKCSCACPNPTDNLARTP